ncbi:MAG: glycosyltransferase family 4 protein [Zetaproteobacteria bacterium]|nr:glycosyltransferase family 4 protein [Zetaproteobacteria bacterium]
MKRPIAFISKSVAPMGGLEADMIKCMRALSLAGHSVHVLYGFKQKGTDEALAGCPNIQFHSIPMVKRPPVIGQIMLFHGIKKALPQLKKQYPNLLTITLERLPFGDIHIGAAPQSLWTQARKRMGLSPFSQPAYRYWLKKMDQMVQRNPNHTLVIFSERDRLALIDAGVSESHVVRLLIPTDTQRFLPNDASKRNYITIIGANPKLKGISLMLQAWPEISRQHPALTLRIVTKGWKVRKLVEQADAEKIELCEFIPNVEYYYQTSRILVAPSMFETWGNVIPEALASGVPVVTTLHVPAHELICHPLHGVTITQEDSKMLTEAICNTLNQPMDPPSQAFRHQRVIEYMTKFPNLVDWLADYAKEEIS